MSRFLDAFLSLQCRQLGSILRVAGLLFLAPLSAGAASDIFLFLDGIPGESVDARHPDWIKVEAFSEGVDRSSVAIRPTFTPLQLIKSTDKASPMLALHAANGRAIKNGTLEVLRASVPPVRFLQVKLSGVTVIGFEQSASRSHSRDSVSLNFNTVQWTYTQIGSDGTPLADITCSWNRLTGTGQGGTLPEDSDGDGLPDEYERLYGLDPGVADAALDLDGDGMTNLDEYRAGTIPNRRDSVFRVTGVRRSSGGISLTWTPVQDKSYRLLGAVSPEGPFEFVRFLTDAEESVGQIDLQAASGHEFFVLEVN